MEWMNVPIEIKVQKKIFFFFSSSQICSAACLFKINGMPDINVFVLFPPLATHPSLYYNQDLHLFFFQEKWERRVSHTSWSLLTLLTFSPSNCCEDWGVAIHWTSSLDARPMQGHSLLLCQRPHHTASSFHGHSQGLYHPDVINFDYKLCRFTVTLWTALIMIQEILFYSISFDWQLSLNVMKSYKMQNKWICFKSQKISFFTYLHVKRIMQDFWTILRLHFWSSSIMQSKDWKWISLIRKQS